MTQMYDKQETFTPQQLAQRWQRSRRTIYRYLKAQKLAHFQIGHKILIPTSEVKRIESQSLPEPE